MATPMQVNHFIRHGVDIVELSGRMVSVHSAELRPKIIACINGGTGRLIIDMRGVSFVDASGLSVLVSAMKAMDATNGRIVLSGFQPHILSLLELTRLHHIFELFHTLDAATESLNLP